MTDENPTPTPEPAPTPTPTPAPTPTPTPTPEPEPTEHPKHDDGPILAAIGELKNMITGLATVASVDDETPTKRPWFARGGKS